MTTQATPNRPRIICIPVTATEIDLLSVTLPSILSNTTAETEILLLAISIDPVLLQSILPESSKIKIAQVTNSQNVWQTVLQELSAHYAQHDIVLLRPGIEVPQSWDLRLALSAYRQPKIAAVVPLCDSSPFLSLFDTQDTEQIDLEQIDLRLLAYSPRCDPEIPILFSGCAYIRREALNDLESQIIHSPLVTAIEWCQQLVPVFQEYGWSVVCCDHVYVRDHAPENRQGEMAAVEALEDIHLIEQVHPLTGLRLAMPEWLKQQDVVSIRVAKKPVQLHIAHSWGGGLDHWVKQYCENDYKRENLVLRSIGNWGAFGQRMAIYHSAAMDQPLRYWDLDYPIRATALVHLQYRAILHEIITDFGVEAILISSLIGHALDALTTRLPTVIIAHDYYPFCPAIVIQFGSVCKQCDLQRLECCFAENEQNRFFRNVSAMEWLRLRRRFAQLAKSEPVQFVVPSPVVAHHWQTLVPELCDQSFTTIPHGLDFAPNRLPAPVAGEKLRVVILGSLAQQKGRALLEQMWSLIAEHVDLYLIGCDGGSEIFPGQSGMTIIPRYEHSELENLLADIQPEVGLLLSIWPETFSYTLSELWLLGIPVVATDLGSFADRIQPGINGFLCSPQAEAVADRLLEIAADRTCLEPIYKWLADFHHRSVEEMVNDYHVLIPLPKLSAARYFATPTAADTAVIEDSPYVLHLDTRIPFSEALKKFGHYVDRKLAMTPQLRSWQKRVLTVLLHLGFRGVTVLTQIRKKA